MAALPLDTFRILYPAFADISDVVVLAVSDQALCFADSAGCKCSDQAWMALTAHLLELRARSASSGGSTPSGPVVSATVGGVSISVAAPQAGDSWSHWMNSTPYGQQAQALLKACSAGGLYVGGLPEREGFLSVYGYRGGR